MTQRPAILLNGGGRAESTASEKKARGLLPLLQSSRSTAASLLLDCMRCASEARTECSPSVSGLLGVLRVDPSAGGAGLPPIKDVMAGKGPVSGAIRPALPPDVRRAPSRQAGGFRIGPAGREGDSGSSAHSRCSRAAPDAHPRCSRGASERLATTGAGPTPSKRLGVAFIQAQFEVVELRAIAGRCCVALVDDRPAKVSHRSPRGDALQACAGHRYVDVARSTLGPACLLDAHRAPQALKDLSPPARTARCGWCASTPRNHSSKR